MKTTHAVNKLLFLIITPFVFQNTYGMTRGTIRAQNKTILHQIKLTEYATFPKPHSKDKAIQFLKEHFLAHDETDIFDRLNGRHPKQQQIDELIQGTSEEATTILEKDFFASVHDTLSTMNKDALRVIYEYLLPENNQWLTAIEDIWIQYANNARNHGSIIIQNLLCIMGKYTIDNGSNIPIKSAKNLFA